MTFVNVSCNELCSPTYFQLRSFYNRFFLLCVIRKLNHLLLLSSRNSNFLKATTSICIRLLSIHDQIFTEESFRRSGFHEWHNYFNQKTNDCEKSGRKKKEINLNKLEIVCVTSKCKRSSNTYF